MRLDHVHLIQGGYWVTKLHSGGDRLRGQLPELQEGKVRTQERAGRYWWKCDFFVVAKRMTAGQSDFHKEDVISGA